ncbi:MULTISPECIES: DUF2501 domain-containing protein [Buttiauxella]|uniref:Protein of uncharacterized function (DUF2501) n=1 Tax=Buttiauxella agrestis TaxID=82977 RepID=A0A381C2Y5_9ENTR|nr:MULTISPECIES: DUF2501 domain-containing protein [Buttiauxella]MCS3603375.1 hypothetical protein [Buttiauxella sp. BIGb0471]BCG07943.1 DUF2501 domain-containing protein [Buttiauxella agrestis]SUW62177.1 Protein of uncharacterised function (DUF2501) [Buttiauxella agrestis]
MKASKKVLCALALATSVFAGQAMAASWQDQLSSAANELSKSTSTSNTGTTGNSVASLTSLLGGGTNALSADTMTNAAGILQYCMKNKLVSATNTDNVKNQLLDKLGLDSGTKESQPQDYTQGLMGLLNTGKDQQVNLNTIGNSSLAEKVKTQACDFVLKQGMNYLS